MTMSGPGGEREPILAPDFVVEACQRGNEEWPQLYCGYIIRGGRMAMRQLVDGEIDFATLQQGELDHTQRHMMYDGALEAHRHYSIDVIPAQRGGDGMEIMMTPGFIAPGMMDRLYKRGLRSILTLIDMAAWTVVDIPDDDNAPELGDGSDQALQRYVCDTFLTEPAHKAQVECLHDIWQAAEAVLDDCEGRQLSTRLRLMLRYVPQGTRQEIAYHRGLAKYAAVTLLHAMVRTAVEPLRPRAIDIFGRLHGTDIIDYFPIGTVLEGGDEPPEPTLEDFNDKGRPCRP